MGVRGKLAEAKKVVSIPLRRVGLRAWCIPCVNASGLGKSQSRLMGTHALAVSHKMGFPIQACNGVFRPGLGWTSRIECTGRTQSLGYRTPGPPSQSSGAWVPVCKWRIQYLEEQAWGKSLNPFLGRERLS